MSPRCGLSQKSGIPTSAQSQVQYVWTFSKTSGESVYHSIPHILSQSPPDSTNPECANNSMIIILYTLFSFTIIVQWHSNWFRCIDSGILGHSLLRMYGTRLHLHHSASLAFVKQDVQTVELWLCAFTSRAAAMTLRTVLLSLQALLAAAEPDDPQDAVVANQVGYAFIYVLPLKHVNHVML